MGPAAVVGLIAAAPVPVTVQPVPTTATLQQAGAPTPTPTPVSGQASAAGPAAVPPPSTAQVQVKATDPPFSTGVGAGAGVQAPTTAGGHGVQGLAQPQQQHPPTTQAQQAPAPPQRRASKPSVRRRSKGSAQQEATVAEATIVPRRASTPLAMAPPGHSATPPPGLMYPPGMVAQGGGGYGFIPGMAPAMADYAPLRSGSSADSLQHIPANAFYHPHQPWPGQMGARPLPGAFPNAVPPSAYVDHLGQKWVSPLQYGAGMPPYAQQQQQPRR